MSTTQRRSHLLIGLPAGIAVALLLVLFLTMPTKAVAAELLSYTNTNTDDLVGFITDTTLVRPAVLINELRGDQPSTDNDEYFELVGPAGTPLDGLTYLVIGDGTVASGVIEAVVDLTGQVIPEDGYFLVAEDSDTFGAAADLVTSINFENSQNATHLLVRDFSGSNADDLDTDDDGDLETTPWEEILDLIAIVEEANPPSGTVYHYGPPKIGPDGSSMPAHVYRCPAGWNIGQYDPTGGDDTPGVVNDCPILINEIRIDQPSTDNDEYVELYAAPYTPLDGLTYLVIGDGASAAGSGVVEAVISLTNQVVPEDGYFLIAKGDDPFSGTADLITSDLNFENSDNVTHLLVRGFSGATDDDLDTDDDGTLDTTPWTEVLDKLALVEEANPPSGTEYHYGPPQIGPDGGYVPGYVYRCPTGWNVGQFDPSGGIDTPGLPNACTGHVIINEVRGDQPSTDADEYFELFGAPYTPLDDLTYVVIGDGTGGSGVIEAVVTLTNRIIPADGYFLAAEDADTFGEVADMVTDTLAFENGDNVTHLLVRDFSGANGDDLDTDDDGTLDTTPWSEILDLVALVEEENPPASTEYHYGPPQIGPDESNVPAHAYRCPAGWQLGAYDPSSSNDTPGAPNDCPIIAEDLGVVKLGPEFALIGEDLVYTLHVRNPSADVATGVRLTDTIPISTTYLSDDSGTMPDNPNDRVYAWDLGDINPGVTVTLMLTVSTDAALSDGHVLVNEAEIGTTLVGDDPLNNSATWETTVYGLVSIYDIQTVPDPAADDESPYLDQVVWVEGVVTAEPGEIGYDTDYLVIEDPAGGPWSGLLVYKGSAFPGVAAPEGAYVRLLGTVDEYYNMTQLDTIGAMEVISTGNPLPPVEALLTEDFINADTAEQWESVLIKFQSATVTNENMGYDEWAYSNSSAPALADDLGEKDGDLTYLPQLDDYYDFIRGIGWYSFDFYKLVPRYDADIQLIRLYKTAEPNVDAGALLTYTVSLENLLSYTLTNVVITDAVPAQNADFAYALDGGAESGGTVTWNLASVPALSTVDVRYVVTATGSVGDIISNTLYAIEATNWITPTFGDPVWTVIGSYTPIPLIQGDGMLSIFEGQIVKTLGYIVGFFEGNNPDYSEFDGFYIQDGSGDGDTATSDGIFVNYGDLSLNFTPAIGDEVEVIGRVQEFGEYDGAYCPGTECLTQIQVSHEDDVVMFYNSISLISPVSLDPPGDPYDAMVYFESLEGMWVTLTITAPVVGPTSHGAIHVIPGDEGVFRAMRTSPQEGMTFAVRHWERYGEINSSDPPDLIVGSVVENVDGPLGYTYGDYNVLTQDGDEWQVVYSAPEPASEPEWPAPGEDQFSVATINTYNFDGADPASKMAKLVATVAKMNGPTFLALQEIRASEVMADLITDLGNEGYPYDYAISHPDVRSYGVAVLWRTDLVSDVSWSTVQGCSPNGNPAATYDTYCDSLPGEYPLFSRRPTVVTGTVNLDNGVFDVVVIGNHFKSKLGGAPSDVRRLEQGQRLNAYVVDLHAAGSTNVVVTGDLNDFEDAAPLTALYASDVLTNTWFTVDPGNWYSYIYQGVSQILDHILVSPDLFEILDGMGPLHHNADYPYEIYHDDDSNVWRTTDHDPLAATFHVNFPPSADADGPYEVDEGASILLDGTGSADPGGAIVTYEWDLDYDGGTFDVDATGATPAFDATSIDGPVGFTVALRATDDRDATDMHTTTVSVLNVDPQAGDDQLVFGEDDTATDVTDTLLANDIDLPFDPLFVYALETSATSGCVTKDVRTIYYDPCGQFEWLAAGETSADSFEYFVSDGDGGADNATVDITINGVNDAPMAVDDSGPAFLTDEDHALTTGSVLTNDSDVDLSDTLAVAGLDSSATAGTVTDNADGTFLYDPTGAFDWLLPGEQATDTFGYVLSDGVMTDTATVTITVTGVNDNPMVDAGGNQNVTEGDLISFEGGIIDPGLRLNAANDILWDFGDGATVTGSLMATHTYIDGGLFIATLTVTDTYGAGGSDTLQVYVQNGVPQISALPDVEVDPEEEFSLMGSFTDPGVLDDHTVVIDWGDGTSETIDLSTGVLDFSAAHSYSDVGPQTVTVTVTDKDGGVGVETFTVDVRYYVHFFPFMGK